MFDDEETGAAAAQTIAAGQLRAFIERIERLEEEKQTVADDIKDVYAEAKGTGFDTKALRAIIRLRKKDQAERQEEEAILDLYKAALGME
ncbi:GapR family DNA-binding domain-containing protein [Pseudaminobacter salicylatoxidans]